MLKKPDGCLGCPLLGDGWGFVPDNLNENSPVTLVAQAPGELEERGRRVTHYVGGEAVTEPCEPQPLVGPTGYMLRNSFLPLAGAEDASLANILKCRWQQNGVRTNKLPTGATLKAAVAHCMNAYFKVPPSTRLIVAHGQHAWTALGGPGSISAWRGHLSPNPVGYPPIPTYATLHTADLFHEPRMDLVARMDWNKIPRILDGTWPEREPNTLTIKPSTLSMFSDWVNEAITQLITQPWVALDTEYNPETQELWLIGMGAPGMPVAQCDWYKLPDWARAEVQVQLVTLARSVPIVMHNALADVPVLRRACGLEWSHYKQIEDTMQAHAVLWSELPHDLEFLASLHGRYHKMKHLRHTDPLQYHKGDVLETISVWQELEKELQSDASSARVYRNQLRLLPHIDRSTSVGIAVDSEVVRRSYATYSTKVLEAQLIAEAYCGYPINLSSDAQVRYWMYTVECHTVRKHRKTRQPTVDKDAVAVMRQKYLPISINEEPLVAATIDRIEQGGHPLLEARALNTTAEQCISHYLNPLMVDA